MYTPLVRESLQEQVFNKLKTLVIEGQLKAGDYLPSERELCEKFGISRIPLREALKKLEWMGVISICHGRKTLINGLGIMPLVEVFDLVKDSKEGSVSDLTEARLLFEVGAAKLAAIRATSDDIKHMKNILKSEENCLGNQAGAIDESLAFHLALVKSSKNKTITNFMIMILGLQRESREITMCDFEGQELSLKDHWKILEYIEKHDAANASNEMRKHLVLRGPCKKELEKLLDEGSE